MKNNNSTTLVDNNNNNMVNFYGKIMSSFGGKCTEEIKEFPMIPYGQILHFQSV